MTDSSAVWVDATGFPVIPSVAGVRRDTPYWCREDVRVRGRDWNFYGSRRWMRVQRLLRALDRPIAGTVGDTSGELAFEVCPTCGSDRGDHACK